jgi:hypothetical protein
VPIKVLVFFLISGSCVYIDWLTQEDISLERSSTLNTGLSGEFNGEQVAESVSVRTPFPSSVHFAFLYILSSKRNGPRRRITAL